MSAVMHCTAQSPDEVVFACVRAQRRESDAQKHKKLPTTLKRIELALAREGNHWSRQFVFINCGEIDLQEINE